MAQTAEKKETNTATDPLLKVLNVETFYGAVMALRGVSMDVHEGKITTILGASRPV